MVAFYESSNLLHGSLPYIMGTRLDALILNVGEAEAKAIWERMSGEIIRLDGLLNKFDPESELSFINRQAYETPVPVCDELWNILLDCELYHKLSLGYFDITLKDFRQIYLDKEEHTLRFLEEGIQLDLGGYAKGYALEKIRDILQREKCFQALINFGNSSILGLGTHPYGENWSIGIPNPYILQENLGTMLLKNTAMSTSGNMPTHAKHILDPHTGLYSEKRRVVSVSSANAIEAEILSTTLMVADKENIPEILSHFQINQYLLFDLP